MAPLSVTILWSKVSRITKILLNCSFMTIKAVSFIDAVVQVMLVQPAETDIAEGAGMLLGGICMNITNGTLERRISITVSQIPINGK